MPVRAGHQSSHSKKNASRRQQQIASRTDREARVAEEVEQYFRQYDNDGSETLDKSEFTQLLISVVGECNVNDEIVTKLVGSSSAGITKQNVNRAIRKYKAYLNEMQNESEALRTIFDQNDKDGDGQLSKEEMLNILKACARTIEGCTPDEVDMEDVDRVFSDADADGSGSIDRDEFKMALCSWKDEMKDVNWTQLAKDFQNPAVNSSSSGKNSKGSSACLIL